MPYGYLGQNTPNQTVSNSGVFSISDVADLEKQGKFGGSLELIEEQTVTSGTTVDFTDLKNYDVHLLQISNIKFSANDTPFIRLSNDGGSTFISTSTYHHAFNRGTPAGSFFDAKSTTQHSMHLGLLSGSTTGSTLNAYFYLYNLLNSSKYSFMTGHSFCANSDGTRYTFGGSVLPTAETHNAIRFYQEPETFTSGNLKLYGVKQL